MNQFENTWYSNLQQTRKKQRQSKLPNMEQYIDHFSQLIQRIGRNQIKKITTNAVLFNSSLKSYLTKRGITVHLKVQNVKQFQKQLQRQSGSLRNTSQTKATCLKKSMIIKQKTQININLQEVEKGFFDIYKKLKICDNQNFEKETKYMREVVQRELEGLRKNKQDYIGQKQNRPCLRIVDQINNAERQYGTFRNIQPCLRIKTKALDQFSQDFNGMINKRHRVRYSAL